MRAKSVQRQELTSDGAVHHCAILELDRHRLVVELHQEAGAGSISTGARDWTQRCGESPLSATALAAEERHTALPGVQHLDARL